MNPSPAVTSQACTSHKQPIFSKNSPRCSSGRCVCTVWKAKGAISPLTTGAGFRNPPQVLTWLYAVLCWVLQTAVRVIAAAGMYLTTRLPPPLKTDISLSLRMSITQWAGHAQAFDMELISVLGPNPIPSTAQVGAQTVTDFPEIWITLCGASLRNARGLQNILGSTFLRKSWKLS